MPGLTRGMVPETVISVGVLLGAAVLPVRARMPLALQCVLAIAVVLAAFAPCPERSLEMAVRFAAAAAFFLLLQDQDDDRRASMACVATVAALFGLGAWLFGSTPRVLAPFGLHHYAAGFLLLHLPITAGLARRMPLWWIAVAVQAAAIAGSRSLAACVVLGLLCLWPLRRRPIWIAAVVLVLAATAIYVPRTRSLLERGEDPSLSTENRVRYLRTGLAMVAARPWGWGLGATPLVAARYRPQTPDVMPQGEVLPHLHDLPLHLAAELGLVGLAAAAMLLWEAWSLPLAAYAIFSLADYQLDLPSMLFALAAVMTLSMARREGTLQPLWRVIFLLAAAAAPFHSVCGWEDFEKGNYVAAAEKMPDLIPVSAAAGASLAATPARAIPYLERAVRLDPYFTLAHYHLGRALVATGRNGIDAFADGMLAQPVTVFADSWDPEVYRRSIRRAIQKLGRPPSDDPRTRHRFEELSAFLRANQDAPPVGTYRRVYSEITDGDLDHSISLQVFRRVGETKYTSPVVVMMPTPTFYIPPGIGYLRGYRISGQ